jgi:hypothetical protein
MSEVIVKLRNPLQKDETLNYYIVPNNTQLAQDWVAALKLELQKNSKLEKNYCWHGWPKTQRNLQYLASELSKHATRINNFNETGIWQSTGLDKFTLRTNFTVDDIMIPITGIDEPNKKGGGPNHAVMNEVHNYFEHLQGTVENLSLYYKLAPPSVKYSIRQINNLCHEIETLCLSIRKEYYQPDWVRPSQITTFLNATRYNLTSEHRKGFLTNGYDRRFAYVYMHWTQIGKTLMEVFRDEGAPQLDQATCDAITHLQYYSGEFDIEWGQSVTYGIHKWHTKEIDEYNKWLIEQGFDPNDPKLSLGHLELGHIDLERSFGTHDIYKIWKIMNNMLDIYSITVDDVTAVYDYNWADTDHEEQQISYLMPGYNSHV